MRFKCCGNDFRSRTSHPRFGVLRQGAVDLSRTECSRFCECTRLSNKCDGSSEGRHNLNGRMLQQTRWCVGLKPLRSPDDRSVGSNEKLSRWRVENCPAQERESVLEVHCLEVDHFKGCLAVQIQSLAVSFSPIFEAIRGNKLKNLRVVALQIGCVIPLNRHL